MQSGVLIGTAGDALYVDVLEVVLHVLKACTVCRACILEDVEVVLEAVLYVLEMLEGMRRAALYAGGCGG